MRLSHGRSKATAQYGTCFEIWWRDSSASETKDVHLELPSSHMSACLANMQMQDLCSERSYILTMISVSFRLCERCLLRACGTGHGLALWILPPPPRSTASEVVAFWHSPFMQTSFKARMNGNDLFWRFSNFHILIAIFKPQTKFQRICRACVHIAYAPTVFEELYTCLVCLWDRSSWRFNVAFKWKKSVTEHLGFRTSLRKDQTAVRINLRGIVLTRVDLFSCWEY